VTLLLSMQDEHRRPARRTTPLRVTATPSPATGLLLLWTTGRGLAWRGRRFRKSCDAEARLDSGTAGAV